MFKNKRKVISKRQVHAEIRLTFTEFKNVAERFVRIFFDSFFVIKSDFWIFNFLSATFRHLQKFSFLFDSQKPPVKKIRGYSGCGASRKRIQNPGVFFCARQNDSRQKRKRLLSRMLAAGFFPLCNRGQRPQVAHLFSAVEIFHQLVVEIMRNFFLFSCPQDELGRVREKSARKIRRRIRLCPGDAVQNPEAQFVQHLRGGKNVVYYALSATFLDLATFSFFISFLSRSSKN